MCRSPETDNIAISRDKDLPRKHAYLEEKSEGVWVVSRQTLLFVITMVAQNKDAN